MAQFFLRNAQLGALGVACIVAAFMITPEIWSGLTTLNASTNQTLPAVYNGGQASFGAAGHGGANTDLTGLQVDQNLLNYLNSNTQDSRYLMAVPSSMQGADYVIATGRPVLYLGGFDGQDPVETTTSLAQLVSSGALKYIYYGGGIGGPRGGANSGLTAWIQANGTIVRGFEAATQNFGAPGGTTSGGTTTNGGGSLRGFGGGMQITLYEVKAGQPSS